MKTVILFAMRNRLLMTVAAILVFAVLAIAVAPPFTTLVEYDEGLAESRFVNIIGTVFFLAPLAVGFVLFLHFRVVRKDGKTPSSRLVAVDRICTRALLVGWHAWVLAHACMAYLYRSNPVWNYWAGQFVGLIGVELAFLTALLWRLAKLFQAQTRGEHSRKESLEQDESTVPSKAAPSAPSNVR